MLTELQPNRWAPWWVYVLVIAPANLGKQQLLPADAAWWLAAISTAAAVVVGIAVVTAVYRASTRPRGRGDRRLESRSDSARRLRAKSMAFQGQTLVNPASGERLTFRQTAADTGGELVAIDLELPPGARVPAGLHFHPQQEERFEVVKGTMRFRLGRKKVVAGPGTVVVVPAGMAHDFANAGEVEARVRVEVRPALKMEQLFETAVALAREGRTIMKGIPKPLDLALFLREFEQEVQPAFPPRSVQRLALAPLAWLARRRGYAARYEPQALEARRAA